MKKLSSVIILLILCSNLANSQFSQEKFIIGTWGNPKPYATGVYDNQLTSFDWNTINATNYLNRIIKAKEAGFNLLVIPHDKNIEATKIANYKILEACSTASISGGDIKLMITDNRQLDEHLWDSSDILSYNPQIRDNIVNDYKNTIPSKLRNYIFGYNIKDEPATKDWNESHYQYCKAWVAGMKDPINGDPAKTAFINLLPVYGMVKPSNNAERYFYDKYLNDYINFDSVNTANNLDIASYDYYPYSDEHPNSFGNEYFSSLEQLKSKAGQKPLWTMIETVRLGDLYNDPAYYRFCANTSLAYGAKGIVYWMYESRAGCAAIVDGDMVSGQVGGKSLQYQVVKQVNSEVKKVGDALFNKTYIGTYHVSDFSGVVSTKGGTRISTSEFIRRKIDQYTPIIESVNATNFLVGIFQDKDNPETFYLYIVDRNFCSPSSAPIEPPSNYIRLKKIGTGVKASKFSNGVFTPITISANSIDISGLLPGAGVLIKLENVWDPNPNANSYAVPFPADYDGDGKSDISLITDDGRWLIDYSANRIGGWDEYLSSYLWTHPCTADYDGDGRADISVKVDDQRWLINYAKDGFKNGWYNTPGDFNTQTVYQGYGDGSALPWPADYDGDGKADISVKTEDGRWLINYANYNSLEAKNGADGFKYGWCNIPGDLTTRTEYFGYGDIRAYPCPADYDGQKGVDFSYYNESENGNWVINYTKKNGPGSVSPDFSRNFGPDLKPCPADYNGDGRADIAFVNKSQGDWYVYYSIFDFNKMQYSFLNTWDVKNSYINYQNSPYSLARLSIPCPADYDGDKKTDMANYYQEDGIWAIDYAANGFMGYDIIYDTQKHLIYKGNSNPSENPLTQKPTEFSIGNYPNPFNPVTRLEYSLPTNKFVTLRVYNTLGKEITTLVNEYKESGRYSVEFNAANLPSGIYIAVINAGEFRESKKMLLIK